jgi:hypothetical protein
MRKNFIGFFIIVILLFSCEVDGSKIIGKKFSSPDLPYGNDGTGFWWRTYINGSHDWAYCTYYKNRVLVYIYNNDDLIITDYFFSKIVKYEKVKNFPLGSDYNDITNKFGKPAFIQYPDILYEDIIEKLSLNKEEIFCCIYLQKYFDKRTLKYELSQNFVRFWFSFDGKLIKVDEHYEWMP